jgi:hypothetical protein
LTKGMGQTGDGHGKVLLSDVDSSFSESVHA